jgi:hypothetical protein
MTWVGHVDFVWVQWTRETVPRKNIESWKHITNRSSYSRCPVSVGEDKYTQQHGRKTKYMTENNIVAQQGKT